MEGREMLNDCHLHTRFSLDSETPVHEVVQQAIALGMKEICITDHIDKDFPEDEDFSFDTGEYFRVIGRLRGEYQDRIRIRAGVELGLQPHLAAEHTSFLQENPFDFVIGSVHLVNGTDPYYPKTFEGKTDRQVYQDYFDFTLENVRAFTGFDVLGHLDYIVRYGKNKAAEYSYPAFAEVIDEILRVLIAHGCGIEANTAGYRKDLGFPNPHPDILRRYRELGGEILTIGSDGHKVKHIGYGFEQLRGLLEDCGFRWYTVFDGRKPSFLPL